MALIEDTLRYGQNEKGHPLNRYGNPAYCTPATGEALDNLWGIWWKDHGHNLTSSDPEKVEEAYAARSVHDQRVKELHAADALAHPEFHALIKAAIAD